GAELEAQLARRLNERQILVCECQDRNLGEIHFLLTRKHQQKIERTFEALDVDDHCRLSCAAVGAERGVELLVAHEAVFRCDAARSSLTICVNILRAASVSNSSGAQRAASAVCARIAASPATLGACPATAPTAPLS